MIRGIRCYIQCCLRGSKADVDEEKEQLRLVLVREKVRVKRHRGKVQGEPLGLGLQEQFARLEVPASEAAKEQTPYARR